MKNINKIRNYALGAGGPRFKSWYPDSKESFYDSFFIGMPYFTYILQSETTDSLYIGSTNNIEDRLIRHNGGRNKYTKNRGPWILLFAVSFESRSEAMRLEKELKSWKSSVRVLQWIETQSR